MSNILIIKHGSLGDIVQISGVIRDIKETYNDKKIFILTTLPYVELLSKCTYLDGVLIDKILKYAQNSSIEFTNKIKQLFKKIKKINTNLWDIEDKLRICEKNKDFRNF